MVDLVSSGGIKTWILDVMDLLMCFVYSSSDRANGVNLGHCR